MPGPPGLSDAVEGPGEAAEAEDDEEEDEEEEPEGGGGAGLCCGPPVGAREADSLLAMDMAAIVSDGSADADDGG